MNGGKFMHGCFFAIEGKIKMGMNIVNYLHLFIIGGGREIK